MELNSGSLMAAQMVEWLADWRESRKGIEKDGPKVVNWGMKKAEMTAGRWELRRGKATVQQMDRLWVMNGAEKKEILTADM